MRLLLAEDETALARRVEKFLTGRGHIVDVVGSGDDAVWMAGERRFDAIVLDVGLPGLSGFDVCRRLRAQEVWTPIIMLTGRAQTEDRVEGLDSGADDYLTKPFELAELDARLRAIARRGQPRRPTTLRSGEIEVDPSARRVTRAGAEIHLTRREFELLHLLMREPGRAVTRDEILAALWDFADEPASNVVDVIVHSLRAKLGSGSAASPIESVRGVGYRFRSDLPDS